jgi:hypothetical protein
MGEGVESFLEVSDGMGLESGTDFWVDARDEADEVFIFFEFFSDKRDGEAVEEVSEDEAVSVRVRVEEVLSDKGEVRGTDFVWLTFGKIDLAELVGELEMIWHRGRGESGKIGLAGQEGYLRR